ncbi:hypothetical protein GCM10025864_01250 [Luteimicrobium album]|uniref:Amidohydrolase n=1 Tax=Luteimicrobium album TaxID=1054550 RepID=A0ABQ6HWG3_9MICO|nr:hypothetical protein GCM10025864_01250 [Luteimicrobium album]
MTATAPVPAADALAARVAALVAELEPELVAVRRDVHAHPELARTEVRTTRVVADRLRAAGLAPRLLDGSGLVCDVGRDGDHGFGSEVPAVALRADIDALPLDDACGLPFASTVPGVAHACGHDVHTAVVLGAGLVLARLHDDGLLPRPVRLIFQPAEEVMPGARSTSSSRAASTASSGSSPCTPSRRSTSGRSARASARSRRRRTRSP